MVMISSLVRSIPEDLYVKSIDTLKYATLYFVRSYTLPTFRSWLVVVGVMTTSDGRKSESYFPTLPLDGIRMHFVW